MDTIRNAISACYADRWLLAKDGERSRSNARLIYDFIKPDQPLTDFTDEVVELATMAWREKGLGPATINRRFASLSVALSLAARKGRNYAFTLPYIPRLKEGPGRTRVLTQSEVGAMVKAVDAYGPTARRYATLIGFLVNSGLRVGEALGIQPEDITRHLERGSKYTSVSLRTTKSGRPRIVPLSDAAAALLSYLHPESLTATRFSKLWVKARRDIGLADDTEFVPHALRHTFASRLVANGTDIAIVSRLLGHANIAMTMRYAHYDTTTLANAVNAL